MSFKYFESVCFIISKFTYKTIVIIRWTGIIKYVLVLSILNAMLMASFPRYIHDGSDSVFRYWFAAKQYTEGAIVVCF